MKQLIYSILRALKEVKINRYILKSKEFDKPRIEAEIVRNVHSIEKGMSIRKPRTGFGVKKINEMFSLIDEYEKLTEEKTVLFFVVDAVSEYLEFQRSIGFWNEDIQIIEEKNARLKEKIGCHNEVCGGTTVFRRADVNFTYEAVESVFNTRHSIREFSGEAVPEDLLYRAIQLAQRAPSACNRQAVRVYSISAKDYVGAMRNMDGIGGFAEDVDRFLIITGKKSAYRWSEKNQFIVSASMFAAYLTLTLHSLGIGACTVQHSLYPSQKFCEFRKKYGIPEDEQTVVTLGIGMMNDEVKVPISKRYPTEKIYKNLSE